VFPKKTSNAVFVRFGSRGTAFFRNPNGSDVICGASRTTPTTNEVETNVKVTPTVIPDVLVIEPIVIADQRGCFGETYRADRYAAAGIRDRFVQDNTSFSHRDVIRGLHFQHPHGQAKLVYVVQGEVLDVAVDVRTSSPTRGKWVSTRLSSENRCQLYIPVGFAHGFAVLSSHAIVAYKCSDYYAPGTERCIRWNDDELGIDWPMEDPVLSSKDASAPLLRDVSPDLLP
jgi:dTDP-4-dehydrorhamnose 3,5-epimerase